MKPFLSAFVVLCYFTISCSGQPEVSPKIENQSPERLLARLIELEQFIADIKARNLASSTGSGSGDIVLGTERSIDNFHSANDGIQLSAASEAVNGNGFYVSLSRTVKVSAGQKIPFDTITTNIGYVYDINTSEFICPISGVYIFHMSLSCEEGSYLEASIVKLSKDNVANPVFNTICDHKPGTGYYQNGGSAILILTEGDKVAVKMLWPNYVNETVTGRGLTTFSGYILRQ